MQKCYGVISKSEAGETVTQADVKAMQRRVAVLEMENEILKKPQPYSPNTVKDKISLVNKIKDSYPVETMCTVLNLNRCSYYKDSKRKPTTTQVSNDELDSKILKLYYESKRRDGTPKIFKVLRNKDKSVSLKRIQRRMAALRIKSVIVKKYKPVKADINIEQKESIMNRDFTAASIKQKWCTGITYIHTEKDGWKYHVFY